MYVLYSGWIAPDWLYSFREYMLLFIFQLVLNSYKLKAGIIQLCLLLAHVNMEMEYSKVTSCSRVVVQKDTLLKIVIKGFCNILTVSSCCKAPDCCVRG